MSYARRPMGDYKSYGYGPYRGDPGFLGSLWKGIKKIAKPLIGVALGLPIGVDVGKSMVPAGAPQPPVGTIAGAVSFPGGVTVSGAMVPGARGMVPTAAGGMVPSGYHFAKDGSGRLVRNRRMNVANPKALRKAMRRVQGFEKLAKRTIVFTKRVKMKKRCA